MYNLILGFKNQHKRNKEHKFHTFFVNWCMPRVFFSYSKSSKSELLILLLDVVDIDDLTLALTDDDDDFGDNTMFVLNPGG